MGFLEPFDAFWVKAFKPGIKLRIPAAGSSSSSSLLASNRVEVSWPEGGNHVKKPKKSKPWTIRLVARSGGREDPGNVFGQLDDAEEGLDFHDLKETPPFDTSYFSILFTNPLFGAVDWGYTSEFRPVSKRPEGEWPFVVKASQDIGEITLHWEGEDYLFEDAWLVDEQNGETVKIEPGGSYAYTTKGAEAHFRIIIQ